MKWSWNAAAPEKWYQITGLGFVANRVDLYVNCVLRIATGPSHVSFVNEGILVA